MRLIGSLLFLVTTLFSANASLSKSSIVIGERVVLVLSGSGKNIEFPNISEIVGYKIDSTGMQQSVNYINGKMTKSIEKHYAFSPLKSIVIPSFDIKVDGKIEKTKSIHVEVKKADTTNSPFLLEMRVETDKVMQFEAVPVEFIFKRDERVEVQDLRFSPPKFDNFWVKDGKKAETSQKNGFIIHKMHFYIFPQKSGKFELTPARVDVGLMSRSRDIFNMLSNSLNWKNIYSNTINLEVVELKGAKLYGDFTIKTSIDRDSINENEGVNLTLHVEGSGNIDDIEDYPLKIKNANIYTDKPVVNSKSLKGDFTQKFSISAKQNFTIPPFSIKYYDKFSKQIVTKTTKPIVIHVKAQIAEKTIQVSTKKEVHVEKRNDLIELVFAFFAGCFITIIAFFVYFQIKKSEYKLPKFKDDKELLKSLLKYRGKDEGIDSQIVALEENLYSKGNKRIDKKYINKFFKS